ncbi:branched-chain amino acid ABC transporter permease [Deinococcus irradiatisoli]|uniref:branched-chain amino acid ABC transporter permease n=1 Tax=Deinococcus irradiatisoli TaxID=2202254 RepID=UPI001FE337B3|nr:branched-chain amino acid ABC transporter permease [Deinococcus irradiatisoli]
MTPQINFRTALPWLAVFVLAALVPLFTHNRYFLDVAVNIMIWTITAYGLNVMLGYAGILQLAHAGFFGIGAYTVGILTLKLGWSFWLAWPLGVALCAVLGLLLGLVAFRTRGDSFAIFTLGVGVIITQIINKWNSLTGGNDGLNGIQAPKLGSIDFGRGSAFFYLALITLGVVVFLVARVRSSMFGRSLIALQGSEDLARTLGINVYTHKLRVMMLSTALAGLAGGLYAVYIGFMGAAITGPAQTFTVLLYLLVGGVGTLSGPLIGTALMFFLGEQLKNVGDYQFIVFGPLLILMVMFAPGGIAGLWQRRMFARRSPATTQEVPDAGI